VAVHLLRGHRLVKHVVHHELVHLREAGGGGGWGACAVRCVCVRG
jgi:hypothetical protein